MNQTEKYDPSFFEQLKKVEKEYFWFKIRRKWIFEKMRKFIPPPARVLEIGCGTGNVSSFLSEKGYLVTGCECYPEAISISWPGFLKVQGDADNLPFKDNSFDIVGLFDILEHFHDDITPLKEAMRVVRKGGIIVTTVPARVELWSWFDEISLHKRRYTIKRLEQIFSEVKLDITAIDYMFMSLYIPMKYSRKNKGENDNLFKINKLVNIFLKWFFDTERIISKGLSLPIGTSLIGVARKAISLSFFFSVIRHASFL